MEWAILYHSNSVMVTSFRFVQYHNIISAVDTILICLCLSVMDNAKETKGCTEESLAQQQHVSTLSEEEGEFNC